MFPPLQTEFDLYVTPDGVEYNLHDFRHRFVLSMEGQGMPPISFRTQRGPFQHGETLLDFMLLPRTVQMLYREQACDREAYWAMRAAILNHLRPNRESATSGKTGVLRKVLPAGEIRDLAVLPSLGPAFSARDTKKWDEWAISEVVRFTAWDPVFFDPAQKSKSLLMQEASDELLFPFTFPFLFQMVGQTQTDTITYIGTWLSYPTIVITGPIESPAIANLTTDELIHLVYDVPAGRTVTIDLAFGEKSIEDDLGTNLIGVLSGDSDLGSFHLAPDPEAPGGVNAMSVQGTGIVAGQTSVEFRWLDRYIGI